MTDLSHPVTANGMKLDSAIAIALWRKKNPCTPLDLCGADLSDADLNGANMSGALLVNANLNGANLNGTDLRNAFLNGANMSGVSLLNANLSGASLVCVDLTNANLTGANLTDVDMTGTNLSDTDLRFASFGRAKLPTNVVVMQVDSYTVIVQPGMITAGCQRHPYDWWQKLDLANPRIDLAPKDCRMINQWRPIVLNIWQLLSDADIGDANERYDF